MLKIPRLQNVCSFLNLLVTTKTHANTVQFFRAVTSLWVILGTLILLPAADQFYSLHSHIPLAETASSDFLWFLNILHSADLNYLYPLFILGQLICACFAGLSLFPRCSSLALYFFTMNLDNRANVIMDGGNNLMHLILFYLIFASPHQRKYTSTIWSYVDNLTTNLSFYMCRIQVALVYLTAGMLKLAGPLWTKGVALYYTMNVVEYGLPSIAKLMSHVPLIMVIATYGTVLFQISFPFMIWNRKARPIYMTIGTLLHLQISLVMGLFMFGLAMCTSYFCFYTDAQASQILNTVKEKIMRLREKIFSGQKNYALEVSK